VFAFKYFGFEWVQALPEYGMYIIFTILGIAAFFVMIGFQYKIAIIIIFLLRTYIFLLDQALYLNHMYLVSLLAFLFIFIPANRAWSVDKKLHPLMKQSIPYWCQWIIMVQFSIVYFFSGIAKVNADWMQGLVLTEFFSKGSPFLDYVMNVNLLPMLSIFIMVYLILLVPFLWWKKTATIAILSSIPFHLANLILFDIDIFPWLMIAGTALFLPLMRKIRQSESSSHITITRKQQLVSVC